MSNCKKYGSVLIASVVNVCFFCVLHYWKNVWTGEMLGVIGIILGLGAVMVLALAETSIVVQLYYRKVYCTYKRYCLDFNMPIQMGIVFFYYGSSSLLFHRIPDADLNVYLVLLPIALSIYLVKVSRTIWKKENIVILLDVDGLIYEIDKVCEREDEIELICKSGEKKVIRKIRRIDK